MPGQLVQLPLERTAFQGFGHRTLDPLPGRSGRVLIPLHNDNGCPRQDEPARNTRHPYGRRPGRRHS
jgi:hypothetical protein